MIKNKPKDKFETLLPLSEGIWRQGKGGLRTKGFFKQSLPNKPLITVVTAVLNGGKFLEETIQSVINQTYDNVEYIIIDGGSTDCTLDIIRKYEHAIDYWVSEKDQGVYDAMNKGISLATGELVGLINASDFYSISTIETVVEFYKTKGADIYFGLKHQIDEDHGLQQIVSVAIPKTTRSLQINNVHPTVFVKRDLYNQVIFDICHKIAADYKLLLEFHLLGKTFFKIDKVLATMRVGGLSDQFNFDSVSVTYEIFGLFEALIVSFKKILRWLFRRTFNHGFLKEKFRLSEGWTKTKTGRNVDT